MANSMHRVSIAGVGYSDVGRNLPLADDELIRQAVIAALDDAGMTRSDIDGISTTGGNAMDIGWTLGIMPLNYFFTAGGLFGQPGPAFAEPAVNAISAVTSGLSRCCLALRLVRRSGTPHASANASDDSSTGAGAMPWLVGEHGEMQFTAPFGIRAAAVFAGFEMRAHMARYGTTEEQFGMHAVNQRFHASLNDDALLRDPITVEDYLNSRYVTTPVRIYDCDYPVDSASAVIFTTEERARDWRQKPVNVEAFALAAIRNVDFNLLDDHAGHNALAYCGEQLWSRTELNPQDVDVAELYDGFSILTFEWLEALRLCGEGEAGPFVEAGHTRLGGSLPLNTDGGASNVGRRHGSNYCIEAVRQLRGQCGERQVKNAETAVWSNGAATHVGAVLLTA